MQPQTPLSLQSPPRAVPAPTRPGRRKNNTARHQLKQTKKQNYDRYNRSCLPMVVRHSYAVTGDLPITVSVKGCRIFFARSAFNPAALCCLICDAEHNAAGEVFIFVYLFFFLLAQHLLLMKRGTALFSSSFLD